MSAKMRARPQTVVFRRASDLRRRVTWAAEVARAFLVVKGMREGKRANDLVEVGRFTQSMTRSIMLMAGATSGLTRLGRQVDWRALGALLDQHGVDHRLPGWPVLTRTRAYELRKAWALVVLGVEEAEAKR